MVEAQKMDCLLNDSKNGGWSTILAVLMDEKRKSTDGCTWRG
jgi:hypothetical protein